VLDHIYFKQSHTILVHLADKTVWQSHNEGFTWNQVQAGQEFLSIAMHPSNKDRAFLITDPNVLGLDSLKFHPDEPDWLIWHGSAQCSSTAADADEPCHTVAHYSRNGGTTWNHIDDYVNSCSWGRDVRFKIDKTVIVCSGHRDHTGNQRTGLDLSNPTTFTVGRNFYDKKTVPFPSGVVGYATFEEYMVVAVVSQCLP
jgi:hypothetical protein